MINLKGKHMLQKMNLEAGIFRILSENNGPSQSELLNNLISYFEARKEFGLTLTVDKASLSRKLKTLENGMIIFHELKEMTNREQISYSYYIKKDLVAFEHIIGHLAKNIDTALDVSPLNRKDWRKFFEIGDDRPRDLTMGFQCAL
jgi:hypothetical protein